VHFVGIIIYKIKYLLCWQPEPAFEGGKWGDRPRPRSDRCPQTRKNFM